MDKKNLRKISLWVIVVSLSAIIIVLGGKYAIKGVNIFTESSEDTAVKAEVIKIIENKSSDGSFNGSNSNFHEDNIKFKCRILSGKREGKVLKATQNINTMFGGSDRIKKVEKGDIVLIGKTQIAPDTANVADNASYNEDMTFSNEWNFVEYYRFNKIMLLALVFAILIIIIGRIKGINALISLSFTAIFVFCVFLPWVLGGKNIYIGVTLTAIFTIIMSLLLIEGASKKCLVTIISCCTGTAIAAAIPFIMNTCLKLSGIIDEHSVYLTMMNPDKPIDLVAIIFAGIIIGALGAIMDVAMDISSSLYEITQHVPDISFKSLFKSGMSIGRDIMGTMANTLVLAYIGSSLCSVLLLVTYSVSITELLNREVVIVELLQALSGSIALLLTVPFTVLIAGIFYLHNSTHNRNKA